MGADFYIFLILADKISSMKTKLFYFIIFIYSIQTGYSQVKFRYGITAGLNVSTAILPELKLNTNLNSILNGDGVIQGKPELADYVALYKAGVFARLDAGIFSLKFNVNYDKTNIHKEVDAGIFSAEALNINLSYLDLDITANINLFKHFYFSAGYIPSFLLEHHGNLNINDFDQRLLTGFGFKFGNGTTLDFDAVIGLSEIIDGSYIHNVMIPVTLSIPLN